MEGCGPRRWSAAGSSVAGFSHIRYRLPNQDAIAWSPRDHGADKIVIALADGHGASMHFRSGTGARIAVDAALRAMGNAIDDLHSASAPTDLSRLAQRLVADWRVQVRAHLSLQPLSDSERVLRRGLDEFTPYGTTLIAVAAGPTGLLALQIGDGDLLLGTAGKGLFRPLPDDVGLVGEQTYSLCQPDAVSYMRARHIDARSDPVDFAMLSTDGLSKSFRDREIFHKLGEFWRGRIAREGLAAATSGLDASLSSMSREGSGDDITVGFLVGNRADPGDAPFMQPACDQ